MFMHVNCGNFVFVRICANIYANREQKVTPNSASAAVKQNDKLLVANKN